MRYMKLLLLTLVLSLIVLEIVSGGGLVQDGWKWCIT